MAGTRKSTVQQVTVHLTSEEVEFLKTQAGIDVSRSSDVPAAPESRIKHPAAGNGNLKWQYDLCALSTDATSFKHLPELPRTATNMRDSFRP